MKLVAIPASGRPGIALGTLAAFFGMIPQAYNKVIDWLLGAPLLAASLDWVGFLDGRMNEIGGITSGLRETNPQKGAEPHMFYILKAKFGHVAFQYKTRHDMVMNNGWQGGDDGIALFAPGQPEPDLRKERLALTGFDDKYMAAGEDGNETVGKGTNAAWRVNRASPAGRALQQRRHRRVGKMVQARMAALCCGTRAVPGIVEGWVESVGSIFSCSRCRPRSPRRPRWVH